MAISGRCVVTGAAGFIGSHLSERLLDLGCSVVGVDCFADYYPRAAKERNLETLLGRPGFDFREDDLNAMDLPALLAGTDHVFHLAGQAGVRASWGDDFEIYVEANILATQRLLEAARGATLRRFVYASSSSIYGDSNEMPLNETARPHPISPYGVTKLAAEHLCHLYHRNFGIPTVSLRYFTVYGPRQRPDMGFPKFIRALLAGEELVVYGDGGAAREFTFVTDIIEANVAAATARAELVCGRPFNVGGGSSVTVGEVIAQLSELAGRPARVRYDPRQPGDPLRTQADCSAAHAAFGYEPRVGLREGLAREIDWLRELQ